MVTGDRRAGTAGRRSDRGGRVHLVGPDEEVRNRTGARFPPQGAFDRRAVCGEGPGPSLRARRRCVALAHELGELVDAEPPRSACRAALVAARIRRPARGRAPRTTPPARGLPSSARSASTTKSTWSRPLLLVAVVGVHDLGPETACMTPSGKPRTSTAFPWRSAAFCRSAEVRVSFWFALRIAASSNGSTAHAREGHDLPGSRSRRARRARCGSCPPRACTPGDAVDAAEASVTSGQAATRSSASRYSVPAS